MKYNKEKHFHYTKKFLLFSFLFPFFCLFEDFTRIQDKKRSYREIEKFLITVKKREKFPLAWTRSTRGIRFQVLGCDDNLFTVKKDQIELVWSWK